MLRTRVLNLLIGNSYDIKSEALNMEPVYTRLGKMKSIPWLGQTLASLCWIISVFVYTNGTEMSTADWLQLAAASCWMISNIASIIEIKST